MARILVIDDDLDMRMVLDEALSMVGHEVVIAANGEEGIKSYKALAADLVITDLFMPKKEGLETIRELKQRFPGAVIIAMSGDSLANSLLAVAKKMGAVRILRKPFHADELLDVVAEVLGEHRTA
jgi:CheY-like chemotaxis protein